jgi:hypothetical protein
MSISRSVGVVLLVVGVVLIIIGFSASRSLADNMSRMFLGRFTEHTMWYIIGGAASAVVGLVLTLGAFGRSRA